MTQLQTRITTAIATSAVLLSSVAPAFAADTIVLSGNARDSESNVAVSENNSNVVSQTNTAVINNNTVVNSNTGGNKANDNAGDVHLNTGNTNAEVDVRNSANNNVANVSGCSACNSGAEVVVQGNARGSENNVALSQNNSNVLFQTNAAEVNNNTVVNTNTGNNRANDNGGDVHMTTGHTNADVDVRTAANTNSALIGGGANGAGNPGVSAYILGNARNSDNNIALSLNNSAVVSQANSAAVLNDTTVNSNTGGNRANDNWGDVHMTTGNTNAEVNHDTAVNFNAAALADCGCADIFAKIAGNARNSDNNLALTKNNAREVFQASAAYVNNSAVDNANTGNNYANDNGSSVLSDPHVTTGHTNSTVSANTSANNNVLGPSLSLPNNAQVNFHWDMGVMGAMFGWMSSIM